MAKKKGGKTGKGGGPAAPCGPVPPTHAKDAVADTGSAICPGPPVGSRGVVAATNAGGSPVAKKNRSVPV